MPYCVVFLFLVLVETVHCSIMCVDCQSKEDAVPGDCRLRPPPPEICPSAEYCNVVKEYNWKGDLINFIRSCAYSDHGNRCIKHSVPQKSLDIIVKYCTSTCDYDGCNGEVTAASTSYHSPPYVLCAFALSLAMYLADIKR